MPQVPAAAAPAAAPAGGRGFMPWRGVCVWGSPHTLSPSLIPTPCPPEVTRSHPPPGCRLHAASNPSPMICASVQLQHPLPPSPLLPYLMPRASGMLEKLSGSPSNCSNDSNNPAWKLRAGWAKTIRPPGWERSTWTGWGTTSWWAPVSQMKVPSQPYFACSGLK